MRDSEHIEGLQESKEDVNTGRRSGTWCAEQRGTGSSRPWIPNEALSMVRSMAEQVTASINREVPDR
jgi:hypothetical protein